MDRGPSLSMKKSIDLADAFYIQDEVGSSLSTD